MTRILGYAKQHKIKAGVLLALFLMLLAVFIGMLLPLGLTKVEVSSQKLPPEFDGFKILQIADLQNSTDEGILRHAQELQPDIIAFTGDNLYHKGSPQRLEWAIQLVKDLSEIAPVYGVSGNHDLWHPEFEKNQRLLEEAGMIHLENKSLLLERNGAQIQISGITDPETFDQHKAAQRVQQYLTEVEGSDGYDILLFHRAGMGKEFSGKGFELILSGHNHGGQIQLPFVGGVRTPDDIWFDPYAQGVHQLDENTTLVISRGIGNTVKIPRIFNPPELVLVTLSRTP